MADVLIALLLLVGAFFGLVGSWGLVRLPQTMQRLHAPTKATTLGVGGVLLASMVYFGWVRGEWSIHELLITLFLFLTAPVSAFMLARAWLHRERGRRRATLPRPGASGVDWGVYQPPPEESGNGVEARR
ncbi:MAG: Na+/H+ antiporter subunit G [Rhodocyclales bacterium]|nr:Na+/H+ antiporter subunit G [Rhodocyclales bacterium]